MTQNERKAQSTRKEIETLKAKLERQIARDDKHLANAKKYGVYFKTRAEWCDFRDVTDFTKMSDKVYNAIWIDECDYREQNDINDSIARAEAKLAKVEGKVESEQQRTAEDARIANIEVKYFNISKEEAERLFKEFQESARKDGIEFESYTEGTTKHGRGFKLIENNGFTERSLHCYTLYIGGYGAIFTSGDFTTAYRYLMNR